MDFLLIMHKHTGDKIRSQILSCETAEHLYIPTKLLQVALKKTGSLKSAQGHRSFLVYASNRKIIL